MATRPVPALSVALPAYEEAANLEALLPELVATLDGLGIDHEIIVVDTETPRDETAVICARAGVTCLPRRGGGLYSHAVRTALGASTGTWVAMMDADGSHPPGVLARLWAERLGADLVIASRYVRGGATDNPPVLILLSRIVNLVFRVILGLRCADVSNSLRLYRGDDVRGLELECENFDIIEEILVKLICSREGYRVVEVPFTFEKRRAGKTKRDLVAFAMGYLGTLRRLWHLKRASRRRAVAP